MSTKEDYYKILGLPREATTDEVKKAYRKAALEWHPDRRPGDKDAEQKFKDASEAYEVLSDPEKRRLYDAYGHEGLDRSGFRGFTNVDDVFSSFGDIFNEFFGGGFFGEQFSRASQVQRGRNHKVVVEITLREAARGITKNIDYARAETCPACHGTGGRNGAGPVMCSYCGGQGRVVQNQGWIRLATTCPRCHGEGRVISDPCPSCRGTGLQSVKRTLSVKVPPGVETGQRIRLKGEGSFGENGAPAGDLYVEINVKEDALFERREQHLVFHMPVSVSQAALGDEVEVPTIWGKAKVRIAPGTQSESPIVLKSEGMPDIRTGARGDQVIVIHVEIPRKLSQRQRELLQEFAKTEDLKLTPQKKRFLEKVKEYLSED